MSFFSELISTVFDRRYQKALASEADSRSTRELCEALLTSHGEVLGFTLARQVLDRYASMSPSEKIELFEFMVNELEIDFDEVIAAVEAYKANPSEASYRTFALASDPRRKELVRRLNQVPGATGKLVALRKDLLSLVKERVDLTPLDIDLRNLFSSWFNRGFLVLRPISWNTPADILEKIIAYEAVHAINNWDELRSRLQPSDRRCYGFFHPAMADEPLIFVEVALIKGIPNSIQSLLANDRTAIEAEDADTAVFYSISNCQAGLAGISFGNSLIKQVVSDLSRDLPQLRTFVTLSPIPGLNRWLASSNINVDEELDYQALAAYYLTEAKRSDGMPYDPVARFHLGNGARIHAVHDNADTSDNGKKLSNGAMVNYLYDLSQISKNHEQFVSEKSVVASDAVLAHKASVARLFSGS